MVRLEAERVVAHVISNARLEGQVLSDQTIDVCRKIARGEMTKTEIDDYKRLLKERFSISDDDHR